MAKQKDKATEIIFTVRIPRKVEHELKEKQGFYSRHELVAESVAEFNKRKHELDEEGFANGPAHERRDVRILELSNGCSVDYKVEPGIPEGDYKQAYIDARDRLQSIEDYLSTFTEELRIKNGDMG